MSNYCEDCGCKVCSRRCTNCHEELSTLDQYYEQEMELPSFELFEGGEGVNNFTLSKDGLCSGLTKREYFAGLAMQGLISSFTEKAANGNWGTEIKLTAAVAIGYADELLKQLEEN